MAMIGRRNFDGIKSYKNGISTIDSPNKLLILAREKSIDILPLDVYALAAELGISIKEKIFEDRKEDLSGVLYREAKSRNWIILVNKCHHPNRKRYTIAHELGHWCLHKDQGELFEDEIFFRGGHADKAEWQANDFASEILMPEDKFLEKIKSGMTEVEDLATEFKVSTIALRIRAKKLGMRGHGL